jgi:hypothetical protein
VRWDDVAAAQAASPSPISAIPPNVASVLVSDAIPPITGPSIAPKIATPIALPINRPRAFAGASAISQASPAVHEHELDAPWRKRATSRSHSLSATPNSAVVTVMPPRPTSSVGFTPTRVASIPAGIPATSAPNAYEPARKPAPVFESPSSSA